MAVELARETNVAGLISAFIDDPHVDMLELSRKRLRARIGQLDIDVVTAKEPHKPWDSKLRDQVLAARRSYWEIWGMVPLEDDLDRASYVDVAFVTYPIIEEKNGYKEEREITEGLTMRTVQINGRVFERMPDDLRFFIGKNRVPLFDLLSGEFFHGSKRLAKEGVVAAARVAPIRLRGKMHNNYTPEAFAAIQVKAAYRAFEDGVALFVNTMRPEMDTQILALPDGTNYAHIRTDVALGLEKGEVKLNREDLFVQRHMFNYLGYFIDARSFSSLLMRLMDSSEGKLDEGVLSALGVSTHQAARLKASQLKLFIPLVQQHGLITSHLTGGELRELILKEVADGPVSYTMTTEERFSAGVRILINSAQVRSSAQSV